MWLSRLVLAFFIIAVFKMIHIQFIKSDDLQAEIIKERVREEVILPERGNILDRNGNILSMSLLMQDVAINPNLIVSEKHQQKVAKVLSENIKGLSYDEVLKAAKDEKSKYKVIAKRVTYEAAKKIRESGIGGIQITQSPKRLYPNDELGATFLGFVNNNSDPGAGVEIKMNEFLAGKNGYTLAEMNPFGEIIPVGSQNVISPIDGQNVQLTIDSYMQHVLEKRLLKAADTVENGGLEPQEIHAVIMNPQNGDILAMASYPSYNPNEYQKYDPKTWTNTPANFAYEPGSIIKPIFMAAALDSGALTGDEILPTGSTVVNGARIRDWNRGQGWGPQNLRGVIKNSSNVGMIAIANKMTNEQYLKGLEKAGFGKPTGIELPGEQSGFNHPTDKSLKDDPIRRANISFGQGIVVTPIQMATAFSEIINGGYELNPTLVKQVTDNNGNLIYAPSKPNKVQKWSEFSATKMREFLKYNMEEGSGRTAQIAGYDGGGKTGSAWYVENGGYAKGKIIGSFLGFLPYENPQYTVLISVKAPKGVEFGSEAANPIFHDVMTEIVRYKGIKPTGDISSEESESDESDKSVQEPLSIDIPDYKWSLASDAEENLVSLFGEDVVVKKKGSGEVVVSQTYVYKNNKLEVNLQTKKIKDGDVYYIPNFVGKKESEAESILKKYKMDYRLHGENKVVEQTVAPGQYFKLKNFQLWLK